MIKKYRCIKDMYYNNNQNDLGFIKDNIYHVDMDEGEVIDARGMTNHGFDGGYEDWVAEYFVEVVDDNSKVCSTCGREFTD